MFLDVIFAATASSLAAPVGITAGVGVIFWAGLALFREVRRVNKADTLMDGYILRIEADNERLRKEKEDLEHRLSDKENRFNQIIKDLEEK